MQLYFLNKFSLSKKYTKRMKDDKKNMFFKMFVKYSHNAYFSLIGSIVFYINHTYKGKVSRDILLC